MMLFASLYLERAPMHWAQLPAAFGEWLQNAGAAAAVAIALVCISSFAQRSAKDYNFIHIAGRTVAFWTYLLYGFFASVACYAVIVLAWIGRWMGVPGVDALLPRLNATMPSTIGDLILTIAGAIALTVALTPVLMDIVSRLSFGRIWALALLSWKEAIRGRVIWVFGAMALIFLFAHWFVPYKAEDQLRNYVRVVFWSMTPLFLVLAALLGAFSIPNDVKNNSIHTVVTKPVEPFEIVLGRFLGFGSLLTVGLFVVSSLSLLYVVRGVTDEAAQESFTARIPIYGKLHFVGTKAAQKGDSVGREWSYRSYITGPSHNTSDKFRQFAVWDFAAFPEDLANRIEEVLFEFSFDIFRLSKGDAKEEGRGIRVTFAFVDPRVFRSPDANFQSIELRELVKKMEEERSKEFEPIRARFEKAKQGRSKEEVGELTAQRRADEEKVREKYRNLYRIHQETGIEVIDYHTQQVLVPPSAFKAFLIDHDKRVTQGENALPMLRVFVSVDKTQQSQMLGVAQADFYMVPHVMPFWQNFLKGTIGMWCTHMLVLAIALAMSTYFSSVISFIATIFLYLCGMSLDYMREIAEGRLDGGGPAESAIRITKGLPVAARFDEATPMNTVIKTLDQLFSWWIGRIISMFPDVGRHDLHLYVANGFDIGWIDVLLVDNLLPLGGYLLPWAVLAYYLMKMRETANPT
ncbi:MAG: ABC transporter permease [Gemmataceae bacterium]|nr:ABC transporter permease [Gemmataceae bacterium]